MDKIVCSLSGVLSSVALNNGKYIRQYVKCSAMMLTLKEKDTALLESVVASACMYGVLPHCDT